MYPTKWITAPQTQGTGGGGGGGGGGTKGVPTMAGDRATPKEEATMPTEGAAITAGGQNNSDNRGLTNATQKLPQ